MNEKITLVYDIEKKAPACALLQAAFGCDHGVLHRYFDAEDWLVSPTDGMRKIAGTDAEWRKVAKITVAEREKREWKP